MHLEHGFPSHWEEERKLFKVFLFPAICPIALPPKSRVQSKKLAGVSFLNSGAFPHSWLWIIFMKRVCKDDLERKWVTFWTLQLFCSITSSRWLYKVCELDEANLIVALQYFNFLCTIWMLQHSKTSSIRVFKKKKKAVILNMLIHPWIILMQGCIPIKIWEYSTLLYQR